MFLLLGTVNRREAVPTTVDSGSIMSDSYCLNHIACPSDSSGSEGDVNSSNPDTLVSNVSQAADHAAVPSAPNNSDMKECPHATTSHFESATSSEQRDDPDTSTSADTPTESRLCSTRSDYLHPIASKLESASGSYEAAALNTSNGKPSA